MLVPVLKRILVPIVVIFAVLQFPALAPSMRSHASPGSVPDHVQALVVAPFAEQGPAQAKGKSLSPRERVDLFEDVWQRVNDRYYDPNFNGVDWKAVHDRYLPLVAAVKTDRQLYVLLSKMVGELHDAHTRFESPEERVDREKLQTVSAGIEINEVDHKPVITKVEPGSDAERSGIQVGMVLTTIDGEPVTQRLEELLPSVAGSSTERAERLRLYRRLLGGEPGTRIELDLARPDETELHAYTTLRIVPDVAEVTSRLLGPGTGYIKLSLWQSPGHDKFKTALDQFRTANGLVLDLRDNPGGEVDEVLKIAAYFFPGRVPFGQFIARSGRRVELFAGRLGPPIYDGPLAIIVDESSGSGSEMFAAVMQESGRAIVVGRQSCGCLLGIAQFRKMRGGSELAISELGYVSPTGRRIEGAGVSPDDAVRVTLADLRANRDAALEDAEVALRKYTVRARH
ncbi:MAG TPA: S41 family peptidase [Blastocatellia bacterium]